jgi:hypothetical protein
MRTNEGKFFDFRGTISVNLSYIDADEAQKRENERFQSGKDERSE